jgi:hypothetical protein
MKAFSTLVLSLFLFLPSSVSSSRTTWTRELGCKGHGCHSVPTHRWQIPSLRGGGSSFGGDGELDHALNLEESAQQEESGLQALGQSIRAATDRLPPGFHGADYVFGLDLPPHLRSMREIDILNQIPALQQALSGNQSILSALMSETKRIQEVAADAEDLTNMVKRQSEEQAKVRMHISRPS